MSYYQSAEKNIVQSKPPRVTRSSLDTRNPNAQSISSNGNNLLTINSHHRQTNLVKPPSPSPSTSNRNFQSNSYNSFNSGSFQNNNTPQRTHRTKESSYLPQKRPDSVLSATSKNKQRNSFLDSDSDEPEDNNTVLFTSKREANKFFSKNDENKTIAKCIFTVDGKSADVELNEKRISWQYISSTMDDLPNSKRSNRKSLGTSSQLYEIPYSRIFSIEPKRVKNSPTPVDFEQRFSLSDEYTIEGFILHVFERLKPNCYQHRSITFSHPHRQTCKQWLCHLYEHVNAFLTEKRLLILMNPFSGEKKTRSIYNFVITPILNLVNFNREVIEFHDFQSLRESLYELNINFNNYYGILVLCGDGNLPIVIRDIVERHAYNENEGEYIDLNKINFKTPLCIIPAGSTNIIANSIYGNNNPYTPLMHLVYGTYINIDITSIYSNDNKFHNFAFGFSCGFGSDLVRYFDRYSRFGAKKLQASLARGAAKKKHKPIEVEIKYLPSTSNQPCDKIRCVRGCQLCEFQEKSLHNGKTVDEVQEFDPLAVSINEIEDNLGDTYRRQDSIDENSQDWKTVCGSFMHIAILTNAMLWDVTSAGLSKYGHLGDGYMDLILVDAVPRKEFYRFLKRHTNKKNQLELPFVKAIRIKEAKIKIKNHSLVQGVGTPLMQSMSYDDSRSTNRKMNHFDSSNTSPKKNKNSMNYESESDTENEIEDFINNNFGNGADNDSESNYRTQMGTPNIGRQSSANSFVDSNDKKKGPSLYYIQRNNENRNEDPDRTINNEEENAEMPRKRSSSLRRSGQFLLQKSKSILNIFQSDSKKNRSNSAVNSSTNDKIETDSQYKHHSARAGSRNEKLQKSNQFKSPFAWNIDWNLCPMPYLHIRCQKQFLPVFGCGIDDDTEIDDTSIKGCFP